MEIKADLISRSAAIEAALDGADEWDGGCSPTREEYIREHMAKVPAVDAAPVIHARWIGYPECLGYDGAYHGEHIVCSECHSVWNIIDNDTERFDYCPACGAKMKEDE